MRRLDLTIATEDHNTPTLDIDKPIADPVSRVQLETLRKNAAEFGVRLHSLGDVEQGVVHVVGPQLGLTQPGTTVVCGDSHTSTHGAFGALAFGIGTSQVEHVLATQTLPLARPKTMAITVDGELPDGVTAKDLILAIIAKIGTGGGQGYILEYRGSAIEKLSMEARMTICNMSIEAGARAGMIAPDETTFEYIKGRAHAPEGEDWDAAVEYWKTLKTDEDAEFDAEVVIDGRVAVAVRHLGHQPRSGRAAFGARPRPCFVRRRFGAPRRRKGPGIHGVGGRTAAALHQGGHRLRRFVHQRPYRGPARRRRARRRAAKSPTAYGCWSSRAPRGWVCRPSPRAWTSSSRRPAPNGGTRAARCAWA